MFNLGEDHSEKKTPTSLRIKYSTLGSEYVQTE